MIDQSLNPTQTGMVTVIFELTRVTRLVLLKVVNTHDESANGNTENVDPDEDSDDSF
jgi:hypothetical protein